MALEEGASETEAALFSILNGSFNSITSVGGGNKDLGGIQSLPQNVKTALQEGNSPRRDGVCEKRSSGGRRGSAAALV